jgi:hypothetical protein
MASTVYRPSEPRNGVLYRVLRDHLAAFKDRVEAAEHPMPGFVERELGALLLCGDPRFGVARIHCDYCGVDGAVPFTCGGDICPCCTGRRMAETAAHLVDRVLPHVPIRQWVITFPIPLRYLLAYDSDIRTEVLNIFVNRVFSWLRRGAKRELGLSHLEQAHPGAVTILQRAGDGLRLNLHPHTLVLDGCYIEKSKGEKLTFWSAPAPTKGDIAQISWEVCERVTRLLQESGQYSDADPGDDELARERPLLAACYAASLQGIVTMGDREGQLLLRLGTMPDATAQIDDEAPILTPGYGYNLHAGVRIGAKDRKGLEKICRYIARGPLANERLSLTSDGRVMYGLRRRWSDGTQSLVFSPLDFISKLVPLIWAPYGNRIRYHGILAPNARLRALVVPTPDDDKQRRPKQLPLPGAKKDIGGATSSGEGAGEKEPRHRYTWSELLRRSFKHEARCPKCGRGQLRVVATITNPAAIYALLRTAGIRCPEAPRANPARAPPSPQFELPFPGPATNAEPNEAA